MQGYRARTGLMELLERVLLVRTRRVAILGPAASHWSSLVSPMSSPNGTDEGAADEDLNRQCRQMGLAFALGGNGSWGFGRRKSQLATMDGNSPSPQANLDYRVGRRGEICGERG